MTAWGFALHNLGAKLIRIPKVKATTVDLKHTRRNAGDGQCIECSRELPPQRFRVFDDGSRSETCWTCELKVRAALEGAKAKTKTCPVCDVEFQVLNKSAVYCTPKCAATAKRMRNQNRKKTHEPT